MRAAVLLYQNMRHAPFLKFYENLFQKAEDIEYDVIYLDRHPELNEPNDEHHIPISWVGKDDHNVISKVLTSIAYPFKARKVLKSKNYDFVFALTTMPGVFLANYLIRNYTDKYLIDIRDYTKEHIRGYYNTEKRVVQNAAINVISSPDYTEFLPEAEYHVCHNLNIPDVETGMEEFKKSPSDKIVIAYVGNIQYVDYCLRLIKLVEMDDRFEFHFYGPEGGSLEVTSHVNNLNNPRISMKGRFKPEEKKTIFSQSDLIFNCYGNDNDIVKYAISNKYYDAAYYRRPLIVSPNTTMSRLAGEFAFPIDLKKAEGLDELYCWYKKVNANLFEQYCSSVVRSAKEDNSRLENLIINTLNENSKR